MMGTKEDQWSRHITPPKIKPESWDEIKPKCTRKHVGSDVNKNTKSSMDSLTITKVTWRLLSEEISYRSKVEC
jgi:hypothetical protein